MGVAEDDTNLRRGHTLLGELADVCLDVGSGSLEPSWRRAAVGAGRLGDTLALAVHASHGEEVGGGRKEEVGELVARELKIKCQGRKEEKKAAHQKRTHQRTDIESHSSNRENSATKPQPEHSERR